MNKPPFRKATIQEVAALAKVSIATVSRALSKPHKVSDKTRALVMEAVKSTGYTVNEAARNLRLQQTGTIVILAPNIGGSMYSNVIEAIEKVFAANNISVLIANTRTPSMSSITTQNYFSQNKVDGMIILDGMMPLDVLLASQNLPPIVLAGDWSKRSDLPVTGIDDIAGVKVAVNHLYDLGHRNIGQVTGPLMHMAAKNRSDGFHEALKELDCKPEEAWQFEAQFLMASGKAAAHNWFALPPAKRPTGVFCAADKLAFGFISTLNKLGVNVPQEVSVVGYDNVTVAEYFIPALTTIHQPRGALGALAATTLLSIMQNSQPQQSALITPYLVRRESTCPPANHFHG